MEITGLLLACLAAFAAGFVNAIAGGGTLISFPVLIALGIPPVAANVTNTIALCPGYFGGTFAQRHHFQSQKQRLWKILPVSITGGIAGGLLLLNNSENSFRVLIPYLILLATVLLAVQTPLKNMIAKFAEKHIARETSSIWLYVFIFLAAIYGGYFGAGLGVMLMAILGLLINESLTKLNVLKQAISLSVNISAAVYFLFSGKVSWLVMAVMMAGAVTGGMIGGKFADCIKPGLLRWVIVVVGFAVAMVYLLK
jgi:uncharacterized protein